LPLACKVNQKIPKNKENVTFLPILIKNIRDFAISTCYLSSIGKIFSKKCQWKLAFSLMRLSEK
jgi:hypothetical protein